eukprot:COSAG06_NODE_10398_length_1687_cov_182.739924_4_plen_63_part_00
MNRVGFHGTHETQPSRMVFLDSRDCTQFTNLTSHYLFGLVGSVPANCYAVVEILGSAPNKPS